jgi:hypothetical protein
MHYAHALILFGCAALAVAGFVYIVTCHCREIFRDSFRRPAERPPAALDRPAS